MNRAQVGITILVAWVAVGLVVGIFMGHHTLLWMILGVVFGPFTIPLAMRSLRDHPAFDPKSWSWGRPERGRPERDRSTCSSGSTAPLIPKPRSGLQSGLLGSRLGRLTLAGCRRNESASSTPPWDDEAQALDILEACETSCRT